MKSKWILLFLVTGTVICNDVQIKQASINLAKMYMQRVAMELESVRNSERESSQEALLLQGVHFAYRTHQVILELAFLIILCMKSSKIRKIIN